MTACIGKQPVEDTGKMLEMETGGGNSSGSLPKQCVGKSRHQLTYLPFRLEEGMSNGLEQRRHAGHGSAEPKLRMIGIRHDRNRS
jgi:hypothetical protein